MVTVPLSAIVVAPTPRGANALTPAQRVAFIRANTKPLTPPLVPEIMLHLAEESLSIWQKTEEQLGLINVPPPYWAFAWAGGQALARYILDNPELVAEKSVLDLGSGSGLTAIASMKARCRTCARGRHRCHGTGIDWHQLSSQPGLYREHG